MPDSSDVVAGTDITAQERNLLRKDIFTGKRINEDVAGASIVTLDLSDVDAGNIKTIDVDQNITLRLSGITKFPTVFFVRFVQDSTGGWEITFDIPGVKYPAGTAPTIADASNEITGLMFIANAVDDYDCYYAGFGLLEPA